MSLLSQVQVKYGAPRLNPNDNFQPLYGAPTIGGSLSRYTNMIFSPLVVIACFVIGTTLYFLTHKKIFLIIPIIFALLAVVNYLVKTIFGI